MVNQKYFVWPNNSKAALLRGFAQYHGEILLFLP
jgi:hypothetical protein